MIGLYLLSLGVFLIFLITFASVWGVPESISDGYYTLKKYGMIPVFTLFCWGVAFPLMIYWIDLLENDWNFLPFIACGSLMFVGASPAFRDFKLESTTHKISAMVCLISSYTWSVLYGSAFLNVNFLALSVLLYLILRNRKVYWVEVVAFINIYAQVIILR